MVKPSRAPQRPAIWAEGRQSPKFDLRAFGRMALTCSRESAAGVMRRCGDSLTGPGADLLARRWTIAPARLGRSGRYLPRSEQLGALLLGLSQGLIQAAHFAAPLQAGPGQAGGISPARPRAAPGPGTHGAPPARRRIMPQPPRCAPLSLAMGAAPGCQAEARPEVRPEARRDPPGAQPVSQPPRPGAAEDSEELELLRKILAEAQSEAGPDRPARSAGPVVPPAATSPFPDWAPGSAGLVPYPGGETEARLAAASAAESSGGAWLLRSGGKVLRLAAGQLRRAGLWLRARYGARAADYTARAFGCWVILCLLPWGLVRAGLAHLNGQDLRDPDLQP